MAAGSTASSTSTTGFLSGSSPQPARTRCRDDRSPRRGPYLGGLEGAPNERNDLALAAAERGLALVLPDDRVQHARLGERTHHRRVQHEQQERGILLADLA